jgi:hypothetical protein
MGGKPEDISEVALRRELNDAMHRIADTGLGGPNVNQRAGIEDAYRQREWLRAFDEELAANKEILEFVQNTRDFHSRVANEFETLSHKMIQKKIDEMAVILKDPDDTSIHPSIYREHMEELVNDFRASGMSWKAYTEALEPDQFNNLALTMRAMADESAESNRVVQLFNQIREMQTKINHMKSLDQSYIPHVEDRQKMEALKNNLIRQGKIRADNDFSAASKDMDTFEKYVERRYFDVNYGNDRKLYAEDKSAMDFAVKNYRSRKEATERLKVMLTNKRSNGEITESEYAQALRQMESMIKEGKRVSREGASEVTKPMFYLEAPETMTGLFQTNNREAFKTFSSQYRAKNFDVKKSSRLDYQRNVDMPFEFRQTDLYKLNNSYANDVAPRLHSMRNGIYDVTDFKQEWVAPLQKQLGTAENSVEAINVAEKLKGIYNTTFRVNSFENPADMASFERTARIANGFRNIMAMAYQYGIGFYNIFEHAVQTPTLTSWRSYLGTMGSFAVNRKQANAMADALLDMKVIDMQLKGHSGNLDMIDEVGGLTMGERLLEKGANFSSNFSFTKLLGAGTMVEKGGLARILFDGFMGGNLMSTAINGHASLLELRKLTEVYQALRNLPEGQTKVIQMHGQRYNIGEVERRLANLGIDETNIRGYMDSRTQGFLKDFMETVKAGKRLTSDELRDNKEALGYIQRVLNTTTENYQATNQFYRPEKAMTPGGRIAFQYSTYSYNQVFQNLQRRIRFPIDDWTSKLPPDKTGNLNMSKILYHYNTGNFQELKNMGLSEEMIQTFPADAYNHIMKYFGAAVGISVLGHMSVDTFRDLVANPFKEDRDDHWRRIDRRKVVNTFAPKSEQYTWGDILDRSVSPDIFHMAQYMAAMAIDTGLMGRLDAVYSSYGKQSLLDLTPASRFVNDLYRDMGKVFQGGVHELSSTMTDVATRNVIRNAPIVGSSPFSELRGTIQKHILDNPNAPNIRMDGGPIIPQAILPR